jgi:Protein of unknown function (DUF3515).
VVAPAYVVRSAAIASLSLLLIGCSRPVDVQAPRIDESCEPILAAAPINILGELQRETTPADAAALAWGDPPIVLACGVRFDVPPDAQIIEVDGVAWVAQSDDAGTVFTTFEADPVIQVRVPAAYRPEVQALTELSALVP